MKVAIPHWRGRVSPVLDAANRLVLCERTDRGTVVREDILLADTDPGTRVDALHQLGVEKVICGTVSQCLRRALEAAGIQIQANICGDVETVIEACLNDRLADSKFSMPGSQHRQQHQRQRRHGWNR